MNTILTYLSRIESLLEQIETMTQNQTTILLHQLDSKEDEALNIIEEIVGYKDKAIQELTEVEALFQESYKKNREALLQSAQIKEIKERVAHILEAKERITKHEQNNLRLLTSKIGKRPEKVEIKPNAQCVANAYKKNQGKS